MPEAEAGIGGHSGRAHHAIVARALLACRESMLSSGWRLSGARRGFRTGCMKATAEQDGNELVNFIGLSAVCRLFRQITLVGRVTNPRASLSQRQHSPYEIGRTSGRPVTRNTFLARPCAYTKLQRTGEAHSERSNDRGRHH